MADRSEYIDLAIVLAQLSLESVLPLLLDGPCLELVDLSSVVNVLSGGRLI